MKKADYRRAYLNSRRGETPKGGLHMALHGDCSHPSKLARRVNRISKLRSKQHHVRGGGL